MFRRFYLLLLLLVLASPAHANDVDLSQGWQLLRDAPGRLSARALPAAGWRPVKVGLSWNAQFPDMRDYFGTCWYRTRFSLDRVPAATHLRFEAADYLATVYVNGHEIGRHEGSYTPFELDASRAVHSGDNELLVQVLAPAPGNSGPYRYDEIPHGKQDWYVQNGGLWQRVTLRLLPADHVAWIHVSASLDGTVRTTTSRAVPLTVFDPSGAVVARGTGVLQVAQPQLWSPQHPALYRIRGGDCETRFGFRQFEARNGQLFLNGKPFYMRAALDQDFYPDTIYTAPSAQYLRDEMRQVRKLGLNMLRCHIKVPQPEYLDAADEAGVLVWTEIPCWNDRYHWTPLAAARGMQTFEEELARDWNHPCIVIQSVINESWGADLKQPVQRRWLQQAYQHVKQETAAVGRVVTDNSACCENFHVQSDLEDFHQYYSIPDRRAKWDEWVDRFATHPAFTFSPFGDARRSGQEPLVLSEFGLWGLPELPQTVRWWMDRQWGDRVMTHAGGVRERFAALGLPLDYNAYAAATQDHEFLGLQHQIEDIRRHESIRGYVITELTDVMWEANGLMDMDRQPKRFAPALAQIQQDDTVMLEWGRHNFNPGDNVTLPVWLSHYSDADTDGAHLVVNGEQSPAPPVADGHVGRTTCRFVAPPVTEPTRVAVHVEWVGRDGTKLAVNEYQVNVFPARDPHLSGVQVMGDDALAKKLGSGSGGLLVTHVPTASSTPVLLLPTHEGPIPGTPWRIVSRQHKNYWGDWIANFLWMRFNLLTPVAGWETEAVTPEYVIEGVKPQQMLAGESFGWVNPTVAVVARQGNLTVCTFRFDRYGEDPYATWLLQTLVREAFTNRQ